MTARGWPAAYAFTSNGRQLETKVDLDYLNQPFDVKQPLRIGGGLGPANRFQGQIADVRVYRSALECGRGGGARGAGAGQPPCATAGDRAQRGPGDEAALVLPRTVCAGGDARPRGRTCSICANSGERLIDSFPTVMVMQDSAPPRETHLLMRGAYDRPGEKVEPGVPAALPPLPAGAPNNRLGSGAVAGGSGESADRARDGESLLADVLRRRAGEDGGGFRVAGRVAVASGVARLAGDGVRAHRLGREGAAEDAS